MRWLTAEGNYAKYVGGNKTRINSEIQRLIFAENPLTTWTAQDVGVTITDLEGSFRKMADWCAYTGQELKGGGKSSEIPDCWVDKTFPYYYDLEPIMNGRPNNRPLHANEDSSSSEDEESSSEAT
jgi:hypothetical protein